MSWFEFDDTMSVDKVDTFNLEREPGLIFNSIKTEEEFEFIVLDLEDKKQDGSPNTTQHVPS